MKRPLRFLVVASFFIVAMAAPATSDGICVPNPENRTQGWCRLHQKHPNLNNPGQTDAKNGYAQNADSNPLTLYIFPVDKKGRYHRFYLQYVNAMGQKDQKVQKEIIDCYDHTIYRDDFNQIDKKLSITWQGPDGRGGDDEGIKRVLSELNQALCLQQNFQVFEGAWPEPPSLRPF